MGYKFQKVIGKSKCNNFKNGAHVKVKYEGTDRFFYAKIDRNHNTFYRVSNIFPFSETIEKANFEIIEEVDIEKAKVENPVMFI